MNKTVLLVILLAVVALVVLYLYSFGPLANRRLAVHPNPESIRPTPVQEQGPVQVSEYHNKDSRENYYRVAFPETWKVEPGPKLGGYLCTFDNGTCSVELMDVPDNTTLELYVLSQEEPKLKNEVPGYVKKSYQKLSVNGSEAHKLEYSSDVNGVQYENARVYIAGQDQADVITITASPEAFTSLAQTINEVITSFNWENQ